MKAISRPVLSLPAVSQLVSSLFVSSLFVLALLTFGTEKVYAQSPPFPDEAAFINLSLKAILSTKGPSRFGSREMLANQISLLQPDNRQRAFDVIVAGLSNEPDSTKVELAAVLSDARSPAMLPWTSSNLDASRSAIYELYQKSNEPTLKTALDGALASSRGGYFEAIDRYNDDQLASVSRATDDLKLYSDKYPKSRFSDQAAYYVGHGYLKRIALDDPQGKDLIKDSNIAFESYIDRAEKGDFIKTDNLASAYYFRGLNGITAGNKADAQSWFSKGGGKFSDVDRVYIYELFFSTDRSLVLDKYVPAKTLFAATANFFQSDISITADRQAALLDQIRGMNVSSN
jgi:hypothetical protein